MPRISPVLVMAIFGFKGGGSASSNLTNLIVQVNLLVFSVPQRGP